MKFTDLEPSRAGDSGDGYIWKYLFTISPSDIIKFDSTDYITVPNDWATYILGEEWKNLMEIIKIISPWMAMMFIASSLSFIFIRLDKQKEIFFFDIFHLVLILISLLTTHNLVNDKWITLYFVTAVQFLFYILSVLIGYFFLNRTIEKTNPV